MTIAETTPLQPSLTEQAPASASQLVLARIRMLAQRRAAWLHHLWHDKGAENGRPGSTTDQSTGLFADLDDPALEAAWLAKNAHQLNAQIATIEAALAEQTDSRLHLLRQIFGLDDQDFNLLQACFALAIDPTLSQIYAYLQDHQGQNYVSEALVARLFGYGRYLIWDAESPLHTWGIIHEREIRPGEPPMLSCDRQIRDWLLGHNDLQEQLVGLSQVHPPLTPLDSWPVSQTVDFLNHLVSGSPQQRVCLKITGLPGSGRRTFAACVSAEIGLPLLVINADQITEDEWVNTFIWAQRQAFLDRSALAWQGQTAATHPWPHYVLHFPIQFIIAEPDQASLPIPETITHEVAIPPLSLTERRALWGHYLAASANWPEGDLDTLAARHQVTVGEIAAIGQKDVASADMAAQLVRAGQRDRLGRLAQRLECPFTWDDLVVNETLQAMLEDFVFEAQERAIFWEQPQARRLFPRGQGLAGLFSGPPGTGKTMAAQVIAATLGLDLFRVDLSTVVSKYVGETSQNLERILSRATHMDIVLLFDEADALFSKRTEVKDAHDRFANTDTNYLLQAIENYDGIALLATNKKANLDAAFIRRLRYVLEFPAPDAAQRRRIWQQILAELAGEAAVSALEPNLAHLAAEVSLTGAQIKYAILAALFMARREQKPLNLDHLLRGLNRELMKEGRALNDREQEKLRRHGD